MHKFLIPLALLWSTSALAETFLVNQLFPTLRIVLSTTAPCDMKPEGLKASAQRVDKLYIPGCWTPEPDHPELIRIDWHNGDFSVLPKEDFIPTKDQQQ